MSDPRKAVFDAVRAISPSSPFNSPDNINALHSLLDAFGAARETNDNRVMKDAAAFYAGLRKITGPLNETQVKVVESIVQSASHWSHGELAYGLATAWHECRLMPIEEIGKGKGKAYGKPGKYGQSPYGRGLVQLTWDVNYEWADKICTKADLIKEGDILKDFDLVMRPDIATMILVKGMETGAFTGKRVGDYIGDLGTPEGFTQARRVINGMDRARDIAAYAMTIQQGVVNGRWS